MNKFKFNLGVRIITALTVLFSCFTALKTEAVEYSPAATFWYFTGATNIPGNATNLSAAVIDCRNYKEFVLSINCGLTNPSAGGTLDFQWTTSSDGVNFCSIPVCPKASGWFSVPLTNGGTNFSFSTNIVVDSIGYWRINWLTNNTLGAHATNFLIQGYQKPEKRSNY